MTPRPAHRFTPQAQVASARAYPPVSCRVRTIPRAAGSSPFTAFVPPVYARRCHLTVPGCREDVLPCRILSSGTGHRWSGERQLRLPAGRTLSPTEDQGAWLALVTVTGTSNPGRTAAHAIGPEWVASGDGGADKRPLAGSDSASPPAARPAARPAAWAPRSSGLRRSVWSSPLPSPGRRARSALWRKRRR